MIFEQEPKFEMLDNRRNRNVYPITIKTLEIKHAAALPKNLIKNKTILDLGSCLGATGYWCLKNGASHYTGVEIQKEFIKTSDELLSAHFKKHQFKIYEKDINEFLEDCSTTYDVVCVFGILYSYFDIVNVLKNICKITNEILIIESRYPENINKIDDSFVSIGNIGPLNLSNIDAGLMSQGALPTPTALKNICRFYGFDESRGLIYPEKVIEVFDVYNTLVKYHDYKFPTRFIYELKRTNIKTQSFSENIKNKNYSTIMTYEALENLTKDKLLENDNKWSFDTPDVSKNFQTIAQTNIPHYELVIDKCLKLADTFIEKDAYIIDVGSALGYTLKKFKDKGYSNLYGVESSQNMIDNMSIKDVNIIKSDTFPKSIKFDFVMANWVMHFILDRKSYLVDIFNSMNDGGILILSDKIFSVQKIELLYHLFKKDNKLSESEIIKKQNQLKGVLIPYTINWYLDTLKHIGFSEIDIIDADFCFNTICARKL